MYTDVIPLPSKGRFYPKDKYNNFIEYIEVGYLTTEDEMMMTSPNLFAKGDSLYRLLERKIKPYNEFISIDDLLVYDRDFILLWLRENAYGNIIEDVNSETQIRFDTHDMRISYLDREPDFEGQYFLPIDEYVFVVKPLTVYQEKLYNIKGTNINKYIKMVQSINGCDDSESISKIIKKLPIRVSRLLKKEIESITYGVDTMTFYMKNFKKEITVVPIDEILFGYQQSNLNKVRETLQESIFFLLNEGQGYTDSDIMKMTTHDRIYNITKLGEKIDRINEEMKK